MNSFGIWGGGLLRWIKNELIWNGGGLLHWIKNELIWKGGGLLHWIKNELQKNFNFGGGGVFYVGSKMNSFGI